MSKMTDADVIVVGTGAAGLMAAITAADEGAKVLQLDKAAEIGGTFLISQGTSSGAAARMQFAAGIYDDSPHIFYKDCMKESRARDVCDPEILMFYCQHAGQTIDWLDKLGAYHGIEREPVPPIYGENWSFKRTFEADSAKNYLKVILSEHEKRTARGDVKVVLQSRVTQLLVEEDKVVGVSAQRKGEKEKVYRSGAVALCTGGFAGGADLMRQYKLPSAKEIISDASPHATGDGLVMSEQVGAQLVNMDQPMLPYIGAVADPVNKGRTIAHVNMDKYPGAVWVNIVGNRVVNEDSGELTPPARIAMQNAPEMALIVIIDSRIKQENPSILVKWFSLPARDWQWFDARAEEGIIVQKSNIIEGLACAMGINGANLQKTISRYNGFVASGADPDFGRKELKYRIERPPFYAVKIVPTVLISSGGPVTNIRQQVIAKSGKIIPGLYAAGEITGYRAFGTGASNIGAIVFGKQAGLMASQYALWQK